VWFFRTTIPSVTPVRSLTRCAEPTALGFIPRYFLGDHGNKTPVRWFTLVCMSSLAQRSFGDFDQALNIAIGKLRSALGDSAESPHSSRLFRNVAIALLRMCRLSIQTPDQEGKNMWLEICRL